MKSIIGAVVKLFRKLLNRPIPNDFLPPTIMSGAISPVKNNSGKWKQSAIPVRCIYCNDWTKQLVKTSRGYVCVDCGKKAVKGYMDAIFKRGKSKVLAE